MRLVFDVDDEIVAWWGTQVECESALARRVRDGTHSQAEFTRARERLDELAVAWREIEPVQTVRSLARRLLRVHPLRAGDALQLAAALSAAGDDLGSLEIVSLDARLIEAAEAEGFRVLP